MVGLSTVMITVTCGCFSHREAQPRACVTAACWAAFCVCPGAACGGAVPACVHCAGTAPFLKENGVPIGEALTAAYESNPFAATTPDMRYKELGGQLRGFQDRIRSTYKREPCPEDLDKNLKAMYKEYHALKVELDR